MAGKKTNPVEKLSYAVLNRLLGRLGSQQLLAFLQRHFQGKKIIERTAGSILRTSCPLNRHDDKNPSFDFDVVNNTIHCYGCGYHTKNFFQFLQDSKGWGYAESAEVVTAQTGIRVFNEKNTKKLEELDIHRTAIATIMRACNKFARDVVIHLKTNINPSEKIYDANTFEAVRHTLDWLYVERKHDPDALPYLPYGILPPINLLVKLVTDLLEEQSENNRHNHNVVVSKEKVEKVLKRITALFANFDTVYAYSVTYHNGYSMNEPGRIRLRRPSKDGSKQIFTFEGFEQDEPVGFFGLFDPYNPYTGEDLKKMVPLLVEGEHDAISIMERLWKEGKTSQLIFALNGNNNELDALHEAGFERIRFWSDGDQGGTDLIKSKIVTALELDVRIFNRWDLFKHVGVKDPDDVIQVFGIEKVCKEVVENNGNHFISLDKWALTQALDAFVGLDDQTNVLEKTRLASEYGKLVMHPALQQQYIKEISKAFDIHAGTVMQEILKRTDTEESFLLRIAETIRRDFHIVFKDEDSKGAFLSIFHKEKKATIKLYMLDGEASAVQLSGIYGTVPNFFRNTVGLPAFLNTAEGLDGNINMQPIKHFYKDMCNYLKIALQHLYGEALDKKSCKVLGQGVHYVPDPETDQIRAYVVNGSTVYKGLYLQDQIEWSLLEGPSDAQYVFNVGFDKPRESWSKEINSISDLNEANNIDVGAYVQKTINLFRDHWSFKHQKLDSQFLGYHLFASAVASAFATMVMVAFIGDTHSGKTTILNIFSGISSKKHKLLESSAPVSNFTQAAIFQGWEDATMALAIDEFEDTGEQTHKARQVADVLAMLRQIVTEEGVTVERGGKDGTTKIRHLKMPIFTAAIRQPREAADLNRRHEIEMNKVAGHADVNTSINAVISSEEYQKLRRMVTLGLLRHMPRLREISEEISKELFSKKLISYNINNRTLMNFIPAASVASLVGDDWRAFIKDSCMARKQKNEAIASETTSQTLYDRILSTASIPVAKSHVKISLSEMLAAEESWVDINKSGTGFFFIPDSRIGLIHWITVQTALLSPWHEYVTVPHRTLKDAFDRHPSAIKTEDYESLGLWNHVRRLIPAARKHDISIVDLKSFIEDVRNRGGGGGSSNNNNSSSNTNIVNGTILNADDNLP